MTVGAVVVTFQRPMVLAATLRALQSQTVPPDWILVVDNGADISLELSIGEEFPDVTYIPSPDNPGYGAALAVGMRWLSGRRDPAWYWLLDDDTPPADTHLESLLALAQRDPRPWVVATRGGRIVHGRIRHDFGGSGGLHRADFTLVDGALFAREAVEAVGFPREDLFMMCEDLDYTTRVADAGGLLLVRPTEVQAMHLGSGSEWRSYYQARNHLRIALDRRSVAWLWGWCYRTGALTLADIRFGRWRRLRMRWKGALDGARGRMGRTL